ncbi:bacteriocin immunity protein, partial [Streptococcus pneumoniae]
APSQERGRLAFLQMLAQTLQGFR